MGSGIFQVFFVFIAGYHLLHTFLGYGVAVIDPTLFSAGKDLVRVLMVLCILLYKIDIFPLFWKQRKFPLILLGVLLCRALGLSVFQGMSRGSIAVGIKYDIYPLIVLMSALAVGYSFDAGGRRDFFKGKKILNILLIILFGGLIWQGAKLLFPDFFMQYIGYGPVGDYLLGNAPPIWYRTGPGGMMRLQGFFSGPNNYGFFLVGVAGLVAGMILKKPSDRKHMLLGLLYVSSLFRTLSRGAWVGAGVAIAITVYFFFPQYKKALLWIGGLGFCGIVGLSIIKGGSTSGHRTALREGITAFLSQPRGYGLGMAGPSVHYEGVYLPENQYMQILLDLGLPGLVLRGGFLYFIFNKSWKLAISKSNDEQYMIILLLLFGIFGLLVEGMFLHVREDSMVNYLILGIFGFYVGKTSFSNK